MEFNKPAYTTTIPAQLVKNNVNCNCIERNNNLILKIYNQRIG